MEKGMLRAGYEKKKRFLMAPHPLTNSELKNFVLNLDKYANGGAHWIALYVEITEIVYCDTFGVEHVFQEKFLACKNTKRNIFRI